MPALASALLAIPSSRSPNCSVDQGPFATEGRRALHEQGWTDSLDRLEELITSREWFGRD